MKKRFKIKKIVKITLILIFVICSTMRYYGLNGTLGINTPVKTSIYNINEAVALNNNYCGGRMKYPDWEIEVLDSTIYDFDDFINTINVDKDEFSDYSTQKVMEITIKLYNKSNQINSIGINDFDLLGVDWAVKLDHILTHKSNPFFYKNCNIEDLGLSLKPNGTYCVKLIYNLYEDAFSKKRYKNLENEKMKLELTIIPENKLIYFRR